MSEEGADLAATRLAGVESRLADLEEQVRQLHAKVPQSGQAAHAATLEALASVRARTAQLEEELEAEGDHSAGGGGEQQSQAAAPSSREAILESPEKMMESLTPLVQKLVEDVVQVAQRQESESLRSELERLRATVEQQLAAPRPSPISQESIVAEVDQRSEARLITVWQELTDYATRATTHVERVEQAMFERMEELGKQVEAAGGKVADNPGFSQVVNQVDEETEMMMRDHSKQLEWLTWRVSWLEWTTGGEKRSFSRPTDPHAPSPLKGPGAKQILSEDSELWAKDSSGCPRLRRPLPASLAGKSCDSLQPMPSQMGSTFKASRSTGKLMPLRPLG